MIENLEHKDCCTLKYFEKIEEVSENAVFDNKLEVSAFVAVL